VRSSRQNGSGTKIDYDTSMTRLDLVTGKGPSSDIDACFSASRSRQRSASVGGRRCGRMSAKCRGVRVVTATGALRRSQPRDGRGAAAGPAPTARLPHSSHPAGELLSGLFFFSSGKAAG